MKCVQWRVDLLGVSLGDGATLLEAVSKRKILITHS
jgi:hypothetical protein